MLALVTRNSSFDIFCYDIKPILVHFINVYLYCVSIIYIHHNGPLHSLSLTKILSVINYRTPIVYIVHNIVSYVNLYFVTVPLLPIIKPEFEMPSLYDQLTSLVCLKAVLNILILSPFLINILSILSLRVFNVMLCTNCTWFRKLALII